MSKITIYISLKDGKLTYHDFEKHKGKTIDTSVDPGDKIIWTLDKDSGISDLSGINIIGSCKFLSKGPTNKAGNKWVSKVSKKAKGEIKYEMFVTASESTTKKSAVNIKATTEGAPSKIKVRL